MQRIRASIRYPASGSPGVITLYTRSTGLENDATAVLTGDRLKNSLTTVLGLFTTTTTFVSDAFVDTMDPATGAITDSNAYTPFTLTGTSGLTFLPLASQICVSWKTAAVIAGRRVRGRTFLGPLQIGANEADGSPAAAALALVETFAASWVDNGLTATFATVWHRPVGGSGGTAEDITGHIVRDKFAVLRSRRD